MNVQQLINKLQMLDPKAMVTYRAESWDFAQEVSNVTEDEGIQNGLSYWDTLSAYKNLSEMEDYYEDGLAFVSLVVLS